MPDTKSETKIETKTAYVFSVTSDDGKVTHYTRELSDDDAVHVGSQAEKWASENSLALKPVDPKDPAAFPTHRASITVVQTTTREDGQMHSNSSVEQEAFYELDL